MRQFLLKNIYRVTPTQLGLRLNIDVLKNASDHIGASLEKHSFKGKTTLKGALSGYIETHDELLLKHHFPLAQLVTIPQAGHWLHAENPKAFAAAINNWCSKSFHTKTANCEIALETVKKPFNNLIFAK